MKPDIQSLNNLECFEFQPKDYSPAIEYKKTRPMMIMNIKQDLRHKCRLVAGGHFIDALNHDIYSATVKSISVKLLQMIAHKANLEILCGNIGNAYVRKSVRHRRRRIWEGNEAEHSHYSAGSLRNVHTL